MHWFVMCFSDDYTHIRVPTFRNHMLQNNDFTKAFIGQYYLPEHQRHSPLFRLVRLVLYVLTMFTVAAAVATRHTGVLESVAEQRMVCLVGCQERHFPLLSCEVRTDVSITVHGNTYSELFVFHRETRSLCSEGVDCPAAVRVRSAVEAAAPSCDAACLATTRPTLDDAFRLGDVSQAARQTLLPLLGTDAVTVLTKQLAWETSAWDPANIEQSCRPLQCPTRDADGRCPVVPCEPESHASCAKYAVNPLLDLDAPAPHWAPPGKERSLRLHSCFSRCRRASETSERGYGRDTRPSCLDQHGDGEYFSDLLCVSPQLPPDILPWLDLWVFCNDAGVCFSFAEVLVAVGLGNCFQLFLEVLLYWMGELVDDDPADVGMSAMKCSAQFLVVIYVFVLILQLIAPLNVADRVPGLEAVAILPNFVLVLVTDQVKNVLTQPLIWCIVMKRCCRLPVGLQEYNDEYLSLWDNEDSLIMQFRLMVKKILDMKAVRKGSLVMVTFYGFFVIFTIVVQGMPFYTPQMDRVLSEMDNYLLYVFVVELCLKFIAYMGENLWPPGDAVWDILDAVVILTSLAFIVTGADVSGVGLLRLMRLLRVVIMFKKVSDGRKRIRELQKKNAMGVGTQVVKVVETLELLAKNKNLSSEQKEEVEWSVDVISQNRLYVVSFDDVDLAEHEKAETAMIAAWLSQSGHAPGTGGGFIEDLEVVKTEPSHTPEPDPLTKFGNKFRERPSKAQKPSQDDRKHDHHHEDVGVTGAVGAVFSGMSQAFTHAQQGQTWGSKPKSRDKEVDKEEEIQRIQRQFDDCLAKERASPTDSNLQEAMMGFDDWNYDAILAHEILGRPSVTVIFCRLMATYEFMHNLRIEIQKIVNFVYRVEAAFCPGARFHGTPRAVDMLQAVHYFHLKGMGEDWVGKTTEALELGRLCLFTSALVAHCGNPGFTNEFLAKTRHPRALRYNDQCVVQNHTMAYISQTLMDPDCAFCQQWDREHVQQFRRALIRMVLKLDLQKHFQEYGELNTKLSSDPNFPQDTVEDRAAMFNFALRAADLAWAARPNMIYSRWAERCSEELFAQGDLEKQVGVSVSAFCDRDLVNAEKVQYANLAIVVGPYLSAFALLFVNKNWSGAKGVQKDVVDDGEVANRKTVQTRLHIADRRG